MSDDPTQVEEQPAQERPTSWLQARVEPFWLNPATIKGTISLLFGLFVMLWPEATLQIFRIFLGAALVASGTSDIWFRRRLRTGGKATIWEGLLSVAAGIALIVWPRAAFFTFLLLLCGYLILRGLFSFYLAWRDRADVSPAGNVVRGSVLTGAGGLILLMPESLLAGTMLVAAVTAFIVGGIMLAYGLQFRDQDDLADIDAATVSQIIRDWADDRDIGETKRVRISDTLFFEPPERGGKLTSWWVMLLLSVAIATFAVLQDSTAVVIGAMLIAPLMTPIMGAAAAIVHGWQGRLVASLALVAAGVAAAIGLAYILAVWVPALVPLEVNSQVISRVSPTLVDMLIALAAGAAGAYATVDDRVSSSITGVAIAVALVPPLSVVGITLEANLWDDALGAFLLFATNLVSIILAGVVVLYLTGFAPFKRFVENRDQILTTIGTVVVAAMLIVVPLFFSVEGILSDAGRQGSATKVVDAWLADSEELSVFQLSVSGADVKVRLTGAGEVPSVEELEDMLTEEFGTPVNILVEYSPTVLIRYSDADGLSDSSQP